MNYLQHSNLIGFAHFMGYTSLNTDGICWGFSLNLALALLTKDKKAFFERLELIAQYKEDFTQLKKEIANIREQVKSRKKSTEDENKLLEIPAFLEAIVLSQDPEKWQEIFDNRYISQGELEKIVPFISSTQLDDVKIPVSIIANDTYALTFSELNAYLTDLELNFKTHRSILPILISNSNHVVLTSYDQEKQKWLYVDTNRLVTYKRESSTYFTELSSSELAEALFDSLADLPSNYLVCNLKAVSNSLTKTQDREVFQSLNSIMPIHVHRYNNEGIGVLNLASQFNDLKTVEKLLKQNKKNNINQLDNYGRTAFYMACCLGFKEMATTLLSQGSDVNQATNNGNTALHVACKYGNIELVKILLNNKAEINKTNKNGVTAFHIACQGRSLEVVEALLEVQGIEINKPTEREGQTPLDLAYKEGNVRIIKALLDKLNKDELITHEGSYILLHLACQKGDVKAVKVLLDKSGRELMNKTNNDGWNALHIACKYGQLEVVKILFDEGINENTRSDCSALHIACKYGQLKIVRFLLDKSGPELINETDNYGGYTALHIACVYRKLEVVKALLDKPEIEVDKLTERGQSALEIACEEGDFGIVTALLDKLNKDGFKFTQEDTYGNTLLSTACRSAHPDPDIVNTLLNKGKMDVNQVNNYQSTALHHASFHGNKDAVDVLLDQDTIKVNAQNKNGRTALHLASNAGQLRVVKTLLQDPRIDIYKKDYEGLTALDDARKNNHVAIVNLLEQYQKESEYHPTYKAAKERFFAEKQEDKKSSEQPKNPPTPNS